MTPLAPHITVFLRERLPIDRRASAHTCDTYAHAFRLLFQYAAARLTTTPSQLHLEQIDAPLVLAFLQHIETERKNGPVTRNARLAAIKSFMRYIEYHGCPAVHLGEAHNPHGITRIERSTDFSI